MINFTQIKYYIFMIIITIITFYKHLFITRKKIYSFCPITNVTLYNTHTDQMLDITDIFKKKLQTIDKFIESEVYNKQFIYNLNVKYEKYDMCYINKNDDDLSVVEISLTS